MKITAKENDVNDIFEDVSITPATIISAFGSRCYLNVCKNVVYIVFFDRYFHYKAIQPFYFSCAKVEWKYFCGNSVTERNIYIRVATMYI